MDLGRLVLETDSPMLSRASGNPYDVVGHAANVAKHRNLPTWVVLRIAALNAKAFYGVYVRIMAMNGMIIPRSGMIIPMNGITIPMLDITIPIRGEIMPMSITS